MNRLTIIIIGSVFFLSCVKSKVRHYDGVVVSPTGTAIPEATVNVQYRAEASSFSDGTDASQQLDVTDANGFFSGDLGLNKKGYTIGFEVICPPHKSVWFRDSIKSSISNMRIVMQ
jgi:hypothetical protein